MWWMLWILIRFTHQIAVCLYSDIAHLPPSQVSSDLRPSTALLASYVTSSRISGFCWYAGLCKPMLTINTHGHHIFTAYYYRHSMTGLSFTNEWYDLDWGINSVSGFFVFFLIFRRIFCMYEIIWHNALNKISVKSHIFLIHQNIL